MTVGRGTHGLGENNGKDDGVRKIASGFGMSIWYGMAWHRIANNGEISQPKPRQKKGAKIGK